MITLSLNFSKLNIPAFIEECRKIIGKMTGNANFVTPAPTLVSITNAINTLETTYQLGLTGDHGAKRLQLQQRRDVNSLMMQLKVYVQVTSGTDESKAISSGMAKRRNNEPHNSIAQPQNVKVGLTGVVGQAKINWKGVQHRKSYLVYETNDLNDAMNRTKWILLGATGAKRYVASGLTSGVEHGFIIVALGARNVQSPPSDPAILVAA